MRDLYKILAAMEEKKIPFCFQCQPQNNYYNISLNDTKGNSKAYGSANIEDIEKWVRVRWGHLLQNNVIPTSKFTPPFPPLPPLPSMR